jgi:hypothetical protein
MRSRCCLFVCVCVCVCLCIPLSLLGNGSVETLYSSLHTYLFICYICANILHFV